jgi:hypothetical protein
VIWIVCPEDDSKKKSLNRPEFGCWFRPYQDIIKFVSKFDTKAIIQIISFLYWKTPTRRKRSGLKILQFPALSFLVNYGYECGQNGR